MASKRAEWPRACDALGPHHDDRLGRLIGAETTPAAPASTSPETQVAASPQGADVRLSVYDGRDHIGWVVDRGTAGVEALDPAEKSIGTFKDVRAAVLAVWKQARGQP
jgi:hypothetical protein